MSFVQEPWRGVLSVIFVTTWVAASGAQAALEEASLATALDAQLPALMERTGIPGLAMAVIEEGQLVLTRQYGVESTETGTEVTEDTLFEAASLSKPVFAYMVLRMVERGELDLDQPLHEILEYERFAGDERALALTPRLVLSHQTGLPNWGRDPLEFRAAPGARFGYSGEGYLYLQLALEKKTGKTLDELARAEVFEPLGMSRSRFSWQEDDRPRLAIGHSRSGNPRQREAPRPNAAGSLFTTAGDYSRFMLALLDAEGLRTETIRSVFEPAVWMNGDERRSPRAEEIAGKVGWGLGWGLQEPGPDRTNRIAWHWGDNDIFHAFVALNPTARSGAVYFANSSNGLSIAQQVVESIVGDMDLTFAWLSYSQSDDVGWTERRAGHMAQRAGDYAAAIKHFKSAVKVDPDDEESGRRVEWLEEMLRVSKAPVSISAELLELYAGDYGPRLLKQAGGKLTYQRQGREPHELIPLSQDTFALDGIPDFRIRVVVDAKGRPERLIGLYVGGHSDESPRDPG